MIAVKPPRTETNMKIDLNPKIGERERFFLQISEFSFAAYPVQINHVFRCLPDAASSPNQSRSLRRNVLRRRISPLLRWVRGKPTAAPATGNITPEQAVP
jgi:hypothetical protein